MKQGFRRVLAHPRFPWLAALIGVLLCLPALGGGLVGDDYLWWVLLQGVGPLVGELPPLLHVYNFIPGGVDWQVLQGQGMVSWWADPDLSIALLRPVSVLTHVADHAVAPTGFVLQHAHSLFWYGLCILVVAWTYRRIHPGLGGVVGLAALLFAVEDAHAMNAAWLANRHALISMVVGSLAFMAHLRWRDTSGLAWLALALLTMTVGLFCGEATLGAAAYLVAWQLTLDEGSWTRRLAGIAPYAALVAAWRVLYNLLGYGIRGSGMYIDPGHDPLGFAAVLVERWPQMQAGQWLQAPVDAVMLAIPIQQHALVTLAALPVCGLLLWYLWPLLRLSAKARFWALGMALSTIPLCAAFPMDRLLAFTGIGAFALLALQARAAGWLDGTAPRISPPRRWLTGGLLLMHLPLAALLLTVRTAGLPVFGQFFRCSADRAPSGPEVEEQVFVNVTGHEFPNAYTALVRWADGDHPPLRSVLLSPFNAEHVVTREDERTLVVWMDGGWLAQAVNRLERSIDEPFTVGEVYEAPDFDAEIRAITPRGDPLEVAFVFERPLEDPLYRWLVWGAQGTEPWTPPAPGERVVLPVQTSASFFAPSPEAGASP